MKTTLRIGCFTVATLLLVVANAAADEVKYELNEAGGSGQLSNSHPSYLNELVYADIGTYQFTGSVNPAQTGLIGVSSGFRAAVSRDVPNFTPDGGGVDLSAAEWIPTATPEEVLQETSHQRSGRA